MRDPSPAPAKIHWTVAIEFLDGTTIHGASAEDIIERWGRLLGWLAGGPLDAAATKQHAVKFARGFYGCQLAPGTARLSDIDFLRELAAAKAIFLIER